VHPVTSNQEQNKIFTGRLYTYRRIYFTSGNAFLSDGQAYATALRPSVVSLYVRNVLWLNGASVTRLLEEKLYREHYIFCDPLTKLRVCSEKLYCNNRWKRCVL